MATNRAEEYGVLLYYKYTYISDLNELFTFYESSCNSLGLLGRVRLATHGVNVTVGGKLSSLDSHIAAVRSNKVFQGTDFKLASCHHPLNDKVAKECGFTALSIRIVKELVTLTSNPLVKSPAFSDAGRHLSALEFHSVLQSDGKLPETESHFDRKNIVLLDARNLYETRIGKFHSPDVETLDPKIRQYSDLPSWIDSNSDQLRGNSILMYCTGGIRCEMASAYIRSLGDGFDNVFQLHGGIQRYLEQFPDGGFFKGKNFVFDHRVSVGSSNPDIMGTCLLCGSPFDDYSSRCRCNYCRMLVLVCVICQKEDALYVCELCQKHGKVIGKSALDEIDESQLTSPPEIGQIIQSTRRQGTEPPRKLKILCLHGFRQNASNFKGRTASLAKKLKSIAEFTFTDAPHELPFIYQNLQSFSHLKFSSSSPPENCKKKFAWLLPPDSVGSTETEWKIAENTFDPLQYQQQTKGFDVSMAYLKTVISQAGPFDGILGFSQGAAMAALCCAVKGRVEVELGFRFVILCSGFVPNLPELGQGLINCPSLHIFGRDGGKDRQIDTQASRDLASLFEDGCSVIIEHDSGHIIPTRSPYIDDIKMFLQRFL